MPSLLLPGVTDAGDAWVAVGPFSTTSHKPLLKSEALSFILPGFHRLTVPSYLLLLLDSLSPDSESKARMERQGVNQKSQTRESTENISRVTGW